MVTVIEKCHLEKKLKQKFSDVTEWLNFYIKMIALKHTQHSVPKILYTRYTTFK